MTNDIFITTVEDIDVEKAVLGSIMIARDYTKQEEFLNYIKVKDFYRVAHKEIYSSMLNLHNLNSDSDNIIDVYTLSQQMIKDSNLEKIGGTAYITDLVNYVPTISTFYKYADIVKTNAKYRQIIYKNSIINEMVKNKEDIDKIIAEIEKTALEVSKDLDKKDFSGMKEILIDTFKSLETRYENFKSGVLSGLDTGYRKINELTGGLQKSNLIILAARPGMGKTALALNLALNIANKNNAVAFFSLEMSKTELMNRLISNVSMIDSKKIMQGNLTEIEWQKIINATDKLVNIPLHIDDSSGITIERLKSKARRLKIKEDIKLIIVDYIQLLVSDKKNENRQNEIAKISRELKCLAKDLDITVVALSQLNRGNEQRADKKPLMSDLRDSGAIEQDADIVILLHRENYYKDVPDKSIDMIFAKHRNGSIGTIKLCFNLCYGKFENITFKDNPIK